VNALRTGKLGRRAAVLLCAALAVVPGARTSRGGGLPPADASPPVAVRGTPACPLCGDLDVPVVTFTAADADSLARFYSTTNEARLARLDSLWRDGRFGTPSGSEARERAHVLARLVTLNAYSYVARFATDSTCVHETTGPDLEAAFRTYSDPGLYPIVRLRRARMGLGRVCLRYDLRDDLDTQAQMGRKRVRVRVQDGEIDGLRRRVLSMNLPTGLDDVVEVLMTGHYTCAVEHVRRDGPPAPYELYLIRGIEGGWLRKWGTHRPEALMFWVTPCRPEPDAWDVEPLAGVRLYVPRLHLQLPLLPDLDFDDLREVDLPQPILDLDYLRRRRHPAWLHTQSSLGFDGWCGIGPTPDDLRRRFPDL
jgi:hypothetical protein